MQQIQNLIGRKLAVCLPLLAVDVKQSARLCRCCRRLCLLSATLLGTALEL